MKYTFAAILIAMSIMLIWAYRSGGIEFALVMAGALLSISFCGMLPVLFAVRSLQREHTSKPTKNTANHIIVKDDAPDSRTLP